MLTHTPTDLGWQGELFTAPDRRSMSTDADVISPRLAYQYAMYGRGVLVDARSEAQLRAEGRIHPDLHPMTPTDLESGRPQMGEAGARPRVMVIGEVPMAVHLLRGAEVLSVAGGFASWRAAYLPTVA